MSRTEIHLKILALLIVVLSQVPSLAAAQWLNIPLPGTPRTPDGKPNLGAPVPRMANGRPDLSGVWGGLGDVADIPLDSVPVARNRQALDIAADVPGGAPLTPWAKAILAARQRANSARPEAALCLPAGLPADMLRASFPFKIVQTPGVTIILLEEFNNWRQIATDGRALPPIEKSGWYGYSVGRWDGDMFVVDTIGFNDQTWLDNRGTPHSESLRLTERFRRIDFGHMEVDYTFEDPMAFTRPWSTTVKFLLRPDTDLMDNQCENNKFRSAEK
jgi:hypothetical protein